MSISNEAELKAMQKVSDIVAITLREMREYTRPGMTTGHIDEYGGNILKKFGARSAPASTYGFPGNTCISLNNEIAHGIPSASRIIREGDLINIDVSAEYGGYWSDNGGSFIAGQDIHQLQHLVDTSKDVLSKAISGIRNGVRIADIGHIIETGAKAAGYKVIRNLAGHGVGSSLHEQPNNILNYKEKLDYRKFRKNTVVAIETFISTASYLAVELKDGWTLAGNKGGYTAQHEHTIVVTDGSPIILTEKNNIWN